MGTVLVIQARLGSTRLPCKTLLTLHGLPLIEWVVNRCAKATLVDQIVVAVPDTLQDEVLARHLQYRNVTVFRGSENDVLGRMQGAAQAHKADTVIRVCADNPLIWGEEIDHLIRFYRAGEYDYAYNHIPKNNLYPDGLGAEIVSAALFERLARTATLPRHREHCLTFITDQPEHFRIATFNPPDPRLHHPEVKLDIDTQDEYVKLALMPLHPTISPQEVIAKMYKVKE